MNRLVSLALVTGLGATLIAAELPARNASDWGTASGQYASVAWSGKAGGKPVAGYVYVTHDGAGRGFYVYYTLETAGAQPVVGSGIVPGNALSLAQDGTVNLVVDSTKVRGFTLQGPGGLLRIKWKPLRVPAVVRSGASGVQVGGATHLVEGLWTAKPAVAEGSVLGCGISRQQSAELGLVLTATNRFEPTE